MPKIQHKARCVHMIMNIDVYIERFGCSWQFVCPHNYWDKLKCSGPNSKLASRDQFSLGGV